MDVAPIARYPGSDLPVARTLADSRSRWSARVFSGTVTSYSGCSNSTGSLPTSLVTGRKENKVIKVVFRYVDIQLIIQLSETN